MFIFLFCHFWFCCVPQLGVFFFIWVEKCLLLNATYFLFFCPLCLVFRSCYALLIDVKEVVYVVCC